MGSPLGILGCGILLVFNCLVTSVDIELSESPNPYGRVEVLLEGGRGTICDQGWDDDDAEAVCRYLRLSGRDYHAFALNARPFGVGDDDQPIVYQNLQCTGYESDLFFCPSDGFKKSNCSHAQDAAVICQIGYGLVPVRLSGPRETAGFVEVYLAGRWGGVCGNGWDSNDAKVVCQQLGYLGDSSAIVAQHEEALSLVWLDGVGCSGSETELWQCPWAVGLGESMCQETGRAGVECHGEDICSSEPDYCLNGGTCLASDTQRLCACPPEYTGTRCTELSNPCDIDPFICSNGATCVFDQGTGATTCNCPNNFKGHKCETEITDGCILEPGYCLNGGLCIWDDITLTPHCQCTQDWTGFRCDAAKSAGNISVEEDRQIIYGYESGGTLVEIAGTGLDPSQMVLYIGATVCPINQELSSPTKLLCVTSSLAESGLESGVRYPISISAPPSDAVVEVGVLFMYIPDPIMGDFEPKTSIVSGGITMTIYGVSFSYLKNPQLHMNVSYQGTVVKMYQKDCEIESNTRIICPYPAISDLPRYMIYGDERTKRSLVPELQRLTVSDKLTGGKLLHRYRRQDIEPPDYGTDEEEEEEEEEDEDRATITEEEIGVTAENPDGTNAALKQTVMTNIVTYYIDPQFEAWPDANHVRDYKPYWPHLDKNIEIKGSYLLTGVTEEEYTVTIGEDECPINDITDDSIICTPPDTKPLPGDDTFDDLPAVYVKLGYLNPRIGYLNYIETIRDDDVFIYTIAGVAVCLFFLIILLVICICTRRKKLRMEAKEPDRKTLATVYEDPNEDSY